MGDINIKPTRKTPSILFNESEKRLIIEGRSILENPARFYKPLIAKLKDCYNRPIGKLEIDFKLEYFNTTSSIVILQVLKHIYSLHNSNSEIIINWYYDEDDEDLLEVGQDYSELLNFPFNLVSIPN